MGLRRFQGIEHMGKVMLWKAKGLVLAMTKKGDELRMRSSQMSDIEMCGWEWKRMQTRWLDGLKYFTGTKELGSEEVVIEIAHDEMVSILGPWRLQNRFEIEEVVDMSETIDNAQNSFGSIYYNLEKKKFRWCKIGGRRRYWNFEWDWQTFKRIFVGWPNVSRTKSLNVLLEETKLIT